MPVLPLAPIVGIFALPVPITIYERTTGLTSKGLPDPSETPTETKATIHQATGRDIQRVEPGRRTTDAIWVFATVPLRTGQSIVYDSKRWLVISAGNWSQQSGHYRALAVAP